MSKRPASADATIRNVAEQAGVSVGTVSRVINGHRYVSEETRARVVDAMNRLHFHPNATARSMRTRTTQAVGFLINDIANPLFAFIVRAAEEAFQASGYVVMLGNCGDNSQRELDVLETMARRQLDGLVISVADENHPGIAPLLKRMNIPVVLLDRELKSVSVDSVLTDHAMGLRQAARHLLQLGHRHIALVTAGENILPGRERRRGFEEALQEWGLKPDPRWIRMGTLDADFAYTETLTMLHSPPRPTAIIAGGNRTLEGVLKAIKAVGLRIPQDLSVISCDDTPLANLMTPSISVVKRDLSEIGRVAARLLCDRMSGRYEAEPRRVILPTGLEVRESVAPPAQPT